MNLTRAEIMIDPWSDDRNASRDTRERQDTTRVDAGSHRVLAAPVFSDMEHSAVDQRSAHPESFPASEDDPLSVLAMAGRLVDRGASYPS